MTNEQRYFADVELPFHVWVREPGARGPRWVLRETAHLGHNASAPSTGNEPRPEASSAP